jgi:spore coat polysaccharide biosynthesis predicted glycosyltransferase SpsG
MFSAERHVACDARVMFVAAAGPRRGYGHLVRCVSFARALGVRPLIAIRGSRRVIETALALGADVLPDAGPRVIRAMRPDVVIVDDPVERTARRWMAAARRAGALVVSVHDLGIGCREADVVIDGSITRARRGPRGSVSLHGSRFALLDPLVAEAARQRRDAGRQRREARKERRPGVPGDAYRRVLIALGGAPRVRLAGAIADAIVAADPTIEVRVAGGFVVAPRAASSKVVWIGASRGLSAELSEASAAVVAGGVSLYEACALGVPAVGLPVVSGQVPTVRAFGRHGAVVPATLGASPDQVASHAVSLLNDRARQQSLARRARALVDGRGAERAAATVVALSQARSQQRGRPVTQRNQ